MRDQTKYIYSRGVHVRSHCQPPPKGVPKADTITLVLHKRDHPLEGFRMYFRPDEASAIASCLTSAVWRSQVRKIAQRQQARKLKRARKPK